MWNKSHSKVEGTQKNARAMWELIVENRHSSTTMAGTYVLMHGRGHQERQNSEFLCGEYALRSLALLVLELSNREKRDEKLLSLVPEGLHQSQLYSRWDAAHPLGKTESSWWKIIYSYLKERKFLWSQFSLFSLCKSSRDKAISTAQYSPFHICLSFWTCFFLPIHHTGKLSHDSHLIPLGT